MNTKALLAILVIGIACQFAPQTSRAQDFQTQSNADTAVTSAAQTWLAAIDHGDYAQSWQESSALFQNAITKDKWATALETVRKPLGDLVSRKLKSAKHRTEMPGAPDGQYVLMQFKTSFANKKSAVETVTFLQEKDGQWRAAGYYIK